MVAALPGQILWYLPTASPCLLALARAYSPHPLIKTVTATAAAAAKAGAEATPSLPASLLFHSQSRNALPLTFWEMPSAPLRAMHADRRDYPKAAVSNNSEALAVTAIRISVW